MAMMGYRTRRRAGRGSRSKQRALRGMMGQYRGGQRPSARRGAVQPASRVYGGGGAPRPAGGRGVARPASRPGGIQRQGSFAAQGVAAQPSYRKRRRRRMR